MASTEFFDRTENLQGQLPRWRENQCLRLTFWQECKAFNRRDDKCCSLACTSLRATDDVSTSESRRNSLGLNGSGNEKARGRQVSQERFGQTNGMKIRVNRRTHYTILSV